MMVAEQLDNEKNMLTTISKRVYMYIWVLGCLGISDIMQALGEVSSS